MPCNLSVTELFAEKQNLTWGTIGKMDRFHGRSVKDRLIIGRLNHLEIVSGFKYCTLPLSQWTDEDQALLES